MTRALLFIAFAAGGFVLVQLGRCMLAQLDRIRELRWKREILESCALRKNRRVEDRDMRHDRARVVVDYLSRPSRTVGEIEPRNVRLTRALIDYPYREGER
jgi:hypothetical protein